MNDLKAGVYRHYKGPLYLVLGLAHDANADSLQAFPPVIPAGGEWAPLEPLGEREVIVYVGLERDTVHLGARLAVRTVDDFFREVCHVKECPRFGVARGSGNHHSGCTVTHQAPRFTYLGARLEGDML